MKISGIICEYNPFHNGHLHHIRETRKNGATHIVAVMSGNFVQRGDTAVMDKLERARLAVRSGADLVIELPVQYSLSSAEKFAEGSVWLLNSLGVVDEISFGSECGDIEKLIKALAVIEKAAVSRAEDIRFIYTWKDRSRKQHGSDKKFHNADMVRCYIKGCRKRKHIKFKPS